MRRSKEGLSQRRFARCSLFRFAAVASLLALVPLAGAGPARGQTSSAAQKASPVTIVAPPHIVAGRPFTLAALGPDGRLAPGVAVRIEPDQQATTDPTGRALFTAAESGSVVFARASGASVAALLDPESAPPSSAALRIAPVLALNDRFSLCGAPFDGRADANRVKINGQPALVLAASPECLVVLPGPKAAPGSATISVEAPAGLWSASTELVSLEFDAPDPPLLPDKQSQIRLRVRGSQQKLRIVVENGSPGVLRFLRGDVQQVVTPGGPENFAALKVKAIRSGDFSLRARLVAAPDASTARRYLDAATLRAPADVQAKLQHWAKRLSGSTRDAEAVRRSVCALAAGTPQGDLRVLLDAACAAL